MQEKRKMKQNNKAKNSYSLPFPTSIIYIFAYHTYKTEHNRKNRK